MLAGLEVSSCIEKLVFRCLVLSFELGEALDPAMNTTAMLTSQLESFTWSFWPGPLGMDHLAFCICNTD